MTFSNVHTHQDFVQDTLPQWFVGATTPQREQLLASMKSSHLSRQQLGKVLASIPDIVGFCRVVLSKALDQEFGPGLDVDKDHFYHAHFRYGFLTGRATFSEATDQSLLQAAMQNYEAQEVVELGNQKASLIHRPGSAIVHAPHITAQRFMALYRRLDLGGKYQTHLNGLLQPDPPVAGAESIKTLLSRRECDALHVQASIALMTRLIDEPACSMLLSIGTPGKQLVQLGSPVNAYALEMLGVRLRGILVFQVLGENTCILYMPGEPDSPLKQYSSLIVFMEQLREKLRMPTYRQYFDRFVPQRSKGVFTSALERCLTPRVLQSIPGEAGLIQRKMVVTQTDENASLRLEPQWITDELPDYLAAQQLHYLKDDARVLAVPTDDEDEKTRKERLAGYLESTLNVLNLAALFVPGLGEVMMLVAGIQLLEETFVGVEAWTHGDMDQAFEHLASIAENLAFMAVLGKVASLAKPANVPPIKPSAFVGRMVPVVSATGKTRLWAPDLKPFECPTVLPPELEPGLDGLLTHEGKQYVPIDGRFYEVKLDPVLNRWRLERPYGNSFSPTLKTNGAGAWHHEGENPWLWDIKTAFKRLGYSVQSLPDEVIEQIVKVTGLDSAALQRLHLNSQAPSPALSDTIKRFRLDQQAQQPGAQSFETLYQASEVTADAGINLLKRDFASLSTAAAREVMAEAGAVQITQMTSSQRIPLAVAGRIREYLQQARLNRAYEGFFLTSVAANPDTQTLALHSLELLPGWSGNVRIEIRQDSIEGALLDSIGSSDATHPTILVRRGLADYAGQGEAGNPATGHDLFSVLLQEMPESTRQATGFAAKDGVAFRRHLISAATGHRGWASKQLGQWAIRPAFKGPMRLASGRLGYPLSGRGEPVAGPSWMRPEFAQQLRGMMAEMYPEATDLHEHVEQLMGRRLIMPGLLGMLRARSESYAALRSVLQDWAGSMPETIIGLSAQELEARRGFAQALSQAWRYSQLHAPRGPRRLLLDSVRLPELSTLPDISAYCQEITMMTLRNIEADGEQINQLLGRFTELTELEIAGTGLTVLPPAVVGLRRLYRLSLSGQGLLINQSMMDLLARIRSLSTLDLSGNTLGVITDVSRFRLQSLSLVQTGLTEWPQWVDALNLQELDVSNNQITHLPESIIQNEINPDRNTVVFGYNNPISAMDLQTYWHNAGYGRAYELEFDFPPDIQGPANSPGGASPAAPQVSIDQWLVEGRDPLNARLRVAWASVEEAEDAPNLLVLLQRLSETRDFDNFHEELSNDVRVVLEAAAEDSELRGELETISNDRMFGADQTCQDGVRLIFSDAQIAVYSHQALEGVAAGQRVNTQFRVLRSLFRLNAVQEIADQEIANRIAAGRGVDQAEVRMAYRIGLANELGLPGQPLSMAFGPLANVDRLVILDARRLVLERETGPEFLEFAANDQRWRRALLAEQGAELERVLAPIQAQMEALSDRVLADDPQAEYLRLRAQLTARRDAAESGPSSVTAQILAQINALDNAPPISHDEFDRQGRVLIERRNAAEDALVRELTNLRRQEW